MERKHVNSVRRLIAPLIAVTLVLLLVGNFQSVIDYVRLYNYQPPAEVSALAEQTTMTDTAKRYFYVNHPEVADRSTFNTECNSRGEHTIVLGCYHSVNRGIYLFDVKDVRLDGVEQVTAAHEMLHAAYDRLSSRERKYIDKQLEDFFANRVQDERIRSTIEAYRESEPDDLVNEMHSIFATEIAELTPELESHYSKYFNNRAKVVEYASTYQKEFTSRQNQVKEYDARLKGLKESIDANSASLKQREQDIQAMQRQMESDRSSGNAESYNARVAAYNARVDAYNQLIRSTQYQIAEYNRLVEERNSLALQVRELTQSISSKLNPIEE
ncbi:MAG: hypothetical protein JWP13_468 [Candidatus Saccharibacteria bacterium]|nr:hypothetical protein [Candidatus Saccharibacteria bacterium]